MRLADRNDFMAGPPITEDKLRAGLAAVAPSGGEVLFSRVSQIIGLSEATEDQAAGFDAGRLGKHLANAGAHRLRRELMTVLADVNIVMSDNPDGSIRLSMTANPDLDPVKADAFMTTLIRLIEERGGKLVEADVD